MKYCITDNYNIDAITHWWCPIAHVCGLGTKQKWISVERKKIETFLAVDFFLTPPVQTRSTNERHENSASQLKFNPKRTHELQFCTFDLFDMIPVTNNKEKPTLGSSKSWPTDHPLHYRTTKSHFKTLRVLTSQEFDIFGITQDESLPQNDLWSKIMHFVKEVVIHSASRKLGVNY